MSDNNSFNSVFGSGGGGGGTIDSGSNVGSGNVEVFKQVVGSDLEFRTLVDTDSIALSYYENDPAPLLNSTIEANVILGNIGIRQSGGWYTFYNDLYEALNNAVSGDVIEFFDNVVDEKTRTLNLVDGVDVNLNGYKYTYDPTIPDNTSMFNNSGTTTNNFRNGTLQRKNAIAQTDFGECEVFSLYANDGEEININLNDCVLINTSRNVISMLGIPTLMSMSGGTIYGGGLILDGITSTYVSAFLSGNISNMNFIVEEVVIFEEGTATNVVIDCKSVIGQTGAIHSGSGNSFFNCNFTSYYANNPQYSKFNNCTFLSSLDTTIIASACEFNNCTIQYIDTTALGGLSYTMYANSSTLNNCYISAMIYSAVYCNGTTMKNCSVLTSADYYVIEDAGESKISNCTIQNINQDATGNDGGVYLLNDGNGASIYSNNTTILSDNVAYAFAGNGATPFYLLFSVIQGTTNIDDGIVLNQQANLIDTLGIIIQG